MLHETVRMMVEKGTAIPPELLQTTAPVRKGMATKSDLRRGLLCDAVGIGLLMFRNVTAKSFGWLFVFVAIAYGANWFIEQRSIKSKTTQE